MCDKCKCTCTRKPEPKKINWDKPIRKFDGTPARVVDKNVKRSDGFSYAVVAQGFDCTNEATYVIDAFGNSATRSAFIENVPDKMVRPVYYLRYVAGFGRTTQPTPYSTTKPDSIYLRLVAGTAIPESDAKKAGFAEWIDA